MTRLQMTVKSIPSFFRKSDIASPRHIRSSFHVCPSWQWELRLANVGLVVERLIVDVANNQKTVQKTVEKKKWKTMA